MKILQLNMWGGNLMHNVIQALVREDADVICLQEVFSMPTGKSHPPLNNLERLKKQFPDHHVFYSPTWASRVEGQRAQYGNAILSKRSFASTEAVFTAGVYNDNLESSKDDNNIRNFQHVVVENESQKMNIINHHGYWFDGEKIGMVDTVRQMAMLHDYVAGLDGSVVLTGDLNLLPDSESLQPLNQTLNNLCITRGIKNTRNQFTEYNNVVCSYIFVDKSVDVKDFTVLDDLISDHAALVVTL